MSEPGIEGRRHGGRFLVNGLWIAAAAIVVSGFVVRSLSSFLNHANLRYSGIVLIAAGVVVALLAWIGERLTAKRADR
jgi:undecaprenyl pyrophosphate phosphatase UppP